MLPRQIRSVVHQRQCWRIPYFPPALRSFSHSSVLNDLHFDTHHFVQRLEREGLNKAQAEGIMSAMAEVIDESIRNMTSNMVTKADQEKVLSVTSVMSCPVEIAWTESLHSASRLRAA